MSQTDKAGVAFWDRRWKNKPVPTPINPHIDKVGNHTYRRHHEYLVKVFQGQNTKGQKLLEIGCGRSRWLPYLAIEFGFEVTGIDYSDVGCETSQAIFDKANVPGRIVKGDFFAPPEDLLGSFDVIFSVGVIEHFTDTAGAITTLSRFLKPGGLMITQIPNMAGWIGSLQKRLDRTVYDVHVPLNREDLRKAHEDAGLSVETCDYLMSVNWAVISFSDHTEGPIFWTRLAIQKGLSMVTWFFDRKGLEIKPNPKTSPFIICTARVPVEAPIEAKFAVSTPAIAEATV